MIFSYNDSDDMSDKFYDDLGFLVFYGDFDVSLHYHEIKPSSHHVCYVHSYKKFNSLFGDFLRFSNIFLPWIKTKNILMTQLSCDDHTFIDDIMTYLDDFNHCMFFSSDMIYTVKNNIITDYDKKNCHDIENITKVFFKMIDKCIDRMNLININDKYLCYVSIGSLSKVKEFVKNGKNKK
jgi:hypothetical protein